MGIRHQLFVIAEVNGHYRSLACVHHQWMSPENAVMACSRIVKIFGCKSNAHPLQRELVHATTLPSSIWNKNLEYSAPPEFPFITTCLLVGASVDFEFLESSPARTMLWNENFSSYENDVGITVIDITDYSLIRYGLILLNTSSWSEGNPQLDASKLMVPLSGSEYLSLFEHLEPGRWRETIKRVDSYPLIDSTVLEQTWPTGKWCSRLENGLTTATSHAPKSNNHSNTQKDGTKSLTHQTIEKAVQVLLNEENSLQYEVEELPEFVSYLQEYFKRHPDDVRGSRFGFDLLQTAFNNAKDLELELFPFLSGEEVLILVGVASGRLDTLNISGNDNVCIEHLAKIPKGTRIKTLYLSGSNDMSLSEAKLALQHCKVGQICHYDRNGFMAAFDKNRTWEQKNDPRGFAHEAARDFETSPEHQNPSMVTSILLAHVAHPDAETQVSEISKSPLIPLFHTQNEIRLDIIPVDDIYLTMQELSHLFADFVLILSGFVGSFCEISSHKTLGLFALGLALRTYENPSTVSSLPPKLYKIFCDPRHPAHKAIPTNPFGPNTRTIVIIRENRNSGLDHFRIGTVSIDVNDKMTVGEFPGTGIDSDTIKAGKIWNKMVKNMVLGKRVVACDEKTVDNLREKVAAGKVITR